MEPNNWKDFLIKYPWAPPRFLKDLFPDFKDYDLANWRKKKQVQAVVDLEKWKLNKEGMSAEKTVRILRAIWKYRIEQEFSINLDSKDAVVKLISVSLPREHALHSFISGVYLKQTGFQWDQWNARGYTAFAFICFHIYPGKDWCKNKGVLPSMFFQTRTNDLSDEEILAVMENIWLRHLHGLDNHSSFDDVVYAKKRFFARYEDQDLNKDWSSYGISSRIAQRKKGMKYWEKNLAKKFGRDLGLIEEDLEESLRWSAIRYRNENPSRELDRCLYTDTIPVDLHHLLSRSKYPDYIYHPENIVPLNPSLHAFITREKWSKEAEKMYLEACDVWERATDGNKISAFDKVMFLLLDEMTPN